MSYEVVSSREVYRGKVFTVRVDQVRHGVGHVFQIDVVEHGGAVTLVPSTPDGRLIFVRQYRHPAGRALIEFPAGTLAPGEAPEACAERECREEIGLRPAEILPLGQIYLAPGYSSELNHIFLVSDFSSEPLPQDEEESIEILSLDGNEVRRHLARGDLRDGKTLAALYLAGPYLGPAFLP